VKFKVFNNGREVDKFDLYGAYLFGTDGIIIRQTKIVFKNGFVVCKKPNLESSGLALLWPIEGFGRVLLPTTCLPDRNEQYNLNVEIARAKLMQIVIKREEWSYFTDMEIGDLEETAREARELFVKAIQNISDDSLASKFADKSLRKSIVLSERLASRQAESLFEARGKNHGFGKGCLGCQIDPAKINNVGYIEKLVKNFSFVMVPVNWAQIEKKQGEYDFSALDECISILGRGRIVIGAGPLLRFSQDHIPKWLMESDVGFEKIREKAYTFTSETARRYANIVRAWRVISGLNAFNHFMFSFEQILEMTRAATMAVKAVSDRALKIVEISNPWGEYYATASSTIPPLVYLDMVVQSGIAFDAFGLQMSFGKDQDGMHVRDMMQISSILDYFGYIAKPLHITDVAVPSKTGGNSSSPEVAGVWRSEWDQKLQREWIEQFYKIALSKSFVDSVTYSNLTDTENSMIANSGLLTQKLEQKQSFQAIKELRKLIFTR
jgi:hypothetical protein